MSEDLGSKKILCIIMSKSEDVMTKDEIKNRLDDLRQFKKSSKKIHFLAKCSDTHVYHICELIHNFILNVIPIKKKTHTIKRKCKKIESELRSLTDCKISIKKKRNLLANHKVRRILFPLICLHLIPYIERQLIVE